MSSLQSDTPMVKKVRKVLVYIALAVVIIGVVGALSISNKLKASEIKALKLEVSEKDDKINTIRAELEQLKKDMEKDQRIGQIHIQSIIKSGSEYADKIQEIQSDDSAIDWLSQPLPDAVVYNYTKRVCQDSGD